MPNVVDVPEGFVVQLNTRESGNAAAFLAIPERYADKAARWREEHACSARDQHQARLAENPGAVLGGPFGGDLSWILMPSTVGLMLDLKCLCGAVLEDVTELAEHW